MPSSEMMSRLPCGKQFSPGSPSSPSAPTPGPGGTQVSLGEPRSTSPPVGLAESKIIAGPVEGAFAVKETVTPQAAHSSSITWPATSGLPAASVSKSILGRQASAA